PDGGGWHPGVEVGRRGGGLHFRDHARVRSALTTLAPVLPAAARRLGLPRSLPGGGVALTFDDGPHPEGTPAMLEILAQRGARAWFFLIGEQVERRPQLAARIAEVGHVVALHGYRHRL